MFLPGNKTQGHLRWASPWFLRFCFCATKEHRHTAGDTILKSSQRLSAECEEHPPSCACKNQPWLYLETYSTICHHYCLPSASCELTGWAGCTVELQARLLVKYSSMHAYSEHTTP